MIRQDFIDNVKAFIEKYPKNHSINSLRNAFSLLERARGLKDIDSNMAAFCAITAEEEAVSSIFLALKQSDYDGADKINHRNHIHKAAFFPFCQALAKTFEVFNKNLPQLAIDSTEQYPRLYIRFTVEGLDGEPLAAKSDVPFGFTISNDASIEYFENNLKQYFGDEFDVLKKWLSNSANKRNRVLYASPSGIPKVKFSDADKYFEEYEKKINALMFLYFLIAPYKEKQLFVQQALHAFMRMIGKMPNEDKLLEMIDEIQKAPIGYNVNLNTGKMTGVQIDGSYIREIEFTANEVNIKVG